MTMNVEVKAKWLNALRSGRYKQGVGKLHSTSKGDRYCCLGVLCDLAAKEGVVAQKRPAASASGRVNYGQDGEEILPRKVADWAGLEQLNPIVESQPLSEWNDTHEWNFDEIADLIEKYL